MGLLRRAAHSMFGDRVPSSEERTLRRQAKQLRRRARWANRLSKNTSATRMLNQQALQMALAYETIREQRYRRLVALYTAKKSHCSTVKYLCRADCSRAVILQLQQQLWSFQSPQQQQQQQQYSPADGTHSSPMFLLPHQSPSAMAAAVAAVPISMQSPATNQSLPPPPAYSGPAFAHYPSVFGWSANASSPTSFASSQSSQSSISSQFSDRNGQLQEPWLTTADKQTMY